MTINKKLVALVGVAISAILLSGCGKTMIVVNGKKISKDEFMARLERVQVSVPNGGTQPAGRYIVQQIINEELVLQLADKEKLMPTQEQQDARVKLIKRNSPELAATLTQQGMTEDEWVQTLRYQLAFNNLLGKGVKISDQEVKDVYNNGIKRSPSPFIDPAKVKISAIITPDKVKIDEAYKLLQQGKDFGAVAEAKSDDPVTKRQRGVLGWISNTAESKVPKPILERAFSLEPKTFSAPFNVQNQWVILKVDQSQPKKVQRFEDVKDLIKEQLQLQKGAQASTFRKDMKAFIGNSKIKVNADKYRGIPEDIKKRAGEINVPETAGNNPAAENKGEDKK
ncbi:MAG: peptidyl-prolyl cis-trans isomerase [Abditibacteriota bacterium]|nr:peptidyl-prolyl cis-trans isomerase [Abditibacteriota bacterium]